MSFTYALAALPLCAHCSDTLCFRHSESGLPKTQRNPSPTRNSTTTGSPQRKSKSSTKPPSVGAGFFNSPPHPKGYDFKDTSVNIATAFQQAAAIEMPTSWNGSTAKGSRGARAAAGGDLANSPTMNGHRKPHSRSKSHASNSITGSIAHVSDSEPESDDEVLQVDSKGRPLSKSSAGGGVRLALNRALSPAAFYVRERSKDPEPVQHNDNLNAPPRSVSRESSYDYSSEQIHYEDLLKKAKAKRSTSQEPIDDAAASSKSGAAGMKKHKNRISLDNQAWKPGQEEAEDDEDYDSDSKKRRKKKKKDDTAGRLTNLPTIGPYGKKRKGRKSGGAPDTIDEENEEDTSFNEDTSGLVNDEVCSLFF